MKIIKMGERRGERGEREKVNNCSLLLDREITAFLTARGGKCFGQWPTKLLHAYVVHHLNRGTCVYARTQERRAGPDAPYLIAAVLFVQPVNTAMAQERAMRGQPSFTWRYVDPEPDAFALAEVVGSREVLNRMDWPDLEKIEGKRILTYRRGKLVELSWDTIWRFLYGMRVRLGHGALGETRPTSIGEGQTHGR